MFANRRPLFVVRIRKIASERPVLAMSHEARNAARFSTPFSTRIATCFATRFATFSTIFHNVCEGVVRMRQGVSGQRDTSPATGGIHRSNGEIGEKCGNPPPASAVAFSPTSTRKSSTRGKPEQRRGTRSSRSGHRYNARNLNARRVLRPVDPPRRFFRITLKQDTGNG